MTVSLIRKPKNADRKTERIGMWRELFAVGLVWFFCLVVIYSLIWAADNDQDEWENEEEGR